MAELLKNELTINVENGEVRSKRVIEDKQTLDDFINIVNKTEEGLMFMKDFVENYEEAKEAQKRVMKLDFEKQRKLKEFQKAWETHEMGMASQKKMWEEKEIPSIEAEIEILREARDKAIAALKDGKKKA